MGHNLEDVTFHGRDHGRDYGRDDGRSVKERTFVISCIAVICKYYVRDVRSFWMPRGMPRGQETDII